MSRSNPIINNPAVRKFIWRGSEEGGGQVTYYDKAEEKDVVVDLPFSFIVLDELNTITGFSEKDHGGFWSNEIRNITKDELVVRTGSGIVARGLYGKIAETIKGKGAKYAKSVYIAFKDESGEFVIGKMQIAGAALTAWIEFQKKFDVMKCAVMITDTPKKAKKGSNTYFVPVFEARGVSTATEQAANKLDEELQTYLNSYLSARPDVDDSEVVDDGPAKEDIEIEDLGTDEDEGDPGPTPEQQAEPDKRNPEDKSINLSDVDF